MFGWKKRKSKMLKVGIIVGSTRPGRKALDVAKWVLSHASARGDATYEVVDIAEYNLPLFDEPAPPSLGRYSKDHTKKWAAKIATLDAFVFVTPEYNHSTSGALKNAIDYLFAEWANKSAGFVGYGSSLGARAIEHLRGIVGELQIADVRTAVGLSLFEDFENFTAFKPRDVHKTNMGHMLDQVVGWGTALKTYREARAK
jgi:NAD(P)H-dependent FMN reductase